MRWVTDYKHPKNLNFIIRKDQASGFHNVYMYQNPKLFTDDLHSADSSCRRHQDDYHQTTLDKAKECALDVYGVPADSWKETK